MSHASDDVDGYRFDRRLFRYGFLCHAGADAPKGDATWEAIRRAWRRAEFDDFVVYAHPETRLAWHSESGRHVVLIGSAFVGADVNRGDVLALAAAASGEELPGLLERLSGRFVLLRLGRGEAKVFHDPCGARSVYYTMHGAFVVGSHAPLVAHAARAGWCADIVALARSATFRKMRVKYLPGDVTLFEGVHALSPNQYYDIYARRVVRYWPQKARGTAGFEDFFHAFDAYAKALVEFLGPPARPVLSITGGIDSRLLLAAFRRHGADFSTVTWTAFNFQAWEVGPVRELVRYLKVPFREVNRSNAAINAAARIGSRNSGIRGPSEIVAGMYRLYGSDERAVFVRGLGAEAIRGFYNAKGNAMKDASPAEMFKAYALSADYSTAAPDPPYERAALAAFESFHDRAGYDRLAAYGFDVSDIFYWEHRVGMWAAPGLNAMDPAIQSLVGFNSRVVFETAYGLPQAERLSKKLLLAAIERYDARMAAVPYQ